MAKTRKRVKLTLDNVHDIRERLAAGESVDSVAARYGVGRAVIIDIQCGRRKKWRDV